MSNTFQLSKPKKCQTLQKGILSLNNKIKTTKKKNKMDLNLKKHKNDSLFLPIYGSNEIGMNLNLYHLDGKWLMVDCGLGFAYDIPVLM